MFMSILFPDLLNVFMCKNNTLITSANRVYRGLCLLYKQNNTSILQVGLNEYAIWGGVNANSLI